MPFLWRDAPLFPAATLPWRELSLGFFFALLFAIVLQLAAHSRYGPLTAMVIGGIIALVGGFAERWWAKAHAIPFGPRRDAFRRRRDAVRPWPVLLPYSLLLGLVMAQVLIGRPLWQFASNAWLLVALAMAMMIIVSRWRRPAAADPMA